MATLTVSAGAASTGAVRRRRVSPTASAAAFRDTRWGQAAAAAALSLSLLASPAWARLEGVNQPQLLPPGAPVPVVDVAGTLTKSQVARLTAEVQRLEKETGVRLRVLAQAYPNTPGLAVRDYWAVDDDTVVYVSDSGLGNAVNVNVGKNVDLLVPTSFWSRLAGKYGTKSYLKDNGEDVAIENVVNAIDFCLREPASRTACSAVQ